jgi:hypothetical protein
MSTETQNKRVSKTELWAQALEVLEANKAPKKLIAALEVIYAPKAGGGTSQNPPKLNEAGEIVEAYCKFHKCYEPVENMVMSGGKSKGYCRAGLAAWNKLNNEVKALNNLSVKLLGEDDFDGAKDAAKRAKEAKEAIAEHEYDLEKDWEAFNAK